MNLRLWKHIWDIFISDETFRYYYTDTPSYDLDMKKSTLNTPILRNRGTLYIGPQSSRDPEGHFIAYEKNSKEIKIFDPSSLVYQQFNNNPNLAVSVAHRSKRNVVKLKQHPQDLYTGDTFCQTWTIAWLKSKLRPLTHVSSPCESVNSMFTIIKTISHSKKFTEYMLYPPNRINFNKLIKRARVQHNSRELCDVVDFVRFTKSLKEQDIARIMKNNV